MLFSLLLLLRCLVWKGFPPRMLGNHLSFDALEFNVAVLYELEINLVRIPCHLFALFDKPRRGSWMSRQV